METGKHQERGRNKETNSAQMADIRRAPIELPEHFRHRRYADSTVRSTHTCAAEVTTRKRRNRRSLCATPKSRRNAAARHLGRRPDRAIGPVAVNQHFRVSQGSTTCVAGIHEWALARHTEQAASGFIDPRARFADTDRRVESLLVIAAESGLGRTMGIHQQGNIETSIVANGCHKVTPLWPQHAAVFLMVAQIWRKAISLASVIGDGHTQ